MKHDRVREHSSGEANLRIDRETQRRVLRASGQASPALTRQIDELDKEWDMERVLETNAAALALSGVLLGLLVNKKFFAVPCFVLPFLLQHALQGWCPPVPMFRRYGVRTRKEIEAEKNALKALRGDFDHLKEKTEPSDRAREAWRAAIA